MKKDTIAIKRQYLSLGSFRDNLSAKEDIRFVKMQGGMRNALYRNDMEAAL